MSDYLKRDIVRQFENSHKTAKPLMELDPARGDEIYNTYIGPNIKALQEAAQDAFGDVFDTEQLFVKQAEIKSKVTLTTTHTGYFNKDDTFGGSDQDEQEYRAESELDEDFTLQIPLSTERLMPKGHSGESNYSSSYSQDVIFNFDRYSDKTVNYLCEVVEYNYKLEAQRSLAVRKVEDLLEQFTTLNQALKAWPALSKLVEPEKLAKVHEKQQRKRKQDLQKQMADKVVVDNELNKTILSASLLEDD